MRWLQIGSVLGRVVVVVGLATILTVACTGEAAPEVPTGSGGTADPVLVEGRVVWQSNCSRCHGGAGGGGAGPGLQGPWLDDRQPDRDTMVAVINEGRGAMPRFGGSLTPAEVEAVVRYIREVL